MISATVLGVLAGLPPASALAVFPGDNGRIGYAEAPAGEPPSHIFTILPDDSGRQQLTPSSSDDRDPSWSADGRRLIFSRTLSDVEGKQTGSQLLTMNADGSEQTRITHSSDNQAFPSFSPDGRRIVFTNGPTSPGESPHWSILTIAADGSDPRLLVSGPLTVGLPRARYSPSGRRIVFDGRPERKHGHGIWTMRRDGSHLRRLTDLPPPDPQASASGAPDYSPDGRHIAFVRGDQIYLIRADGSRERRIPGTRLFTSPAYAPAGDRIAMVEVSAPFSDCGDIFTVSLTGSDRQRVTGPCDPLGSAILLSLSWQPVPGPPSNHFSFGKVKRNRKRGTARLGVRVPGSGDLELRKTKKVKPASKRAAGSGDVRLRIRPRDTANRQLRARGKAKLKAHVRYSPDGGIPNTKSKGIKLEKRRR